MKILFLGLLFYSQVSSGVAQPKSLVAPEAAHDPIFNGVLDKFGPLKGSVKSFVQRQSDKCERVCNPTKFRYSSLYTFDVDGRLVEEKPLEYKIENSTRYFYKDNERYPIRAESWTNSGDKSKIEIDNTRHYKRDAYGNVLSVNSKNGEQVFKWSSDGKEMMALPYRLLVGVPINGMENNYHIKYFEDGRMIKIRRFNTQTIGDTLSGRTLNSDKSNDEEFIYYSFHSNGLVKNKKINRLFNGKSNTESFDFNFDGTPEKSISSDVFNQDNWHRFVWFDYVFDLAGNVTSALECKVENNLQNIQWCVRYENDIEYYPVSAFDKFKKSYLPGN